MNREILETKASTFLDQLFTELEKNKVDVSDLELDHICWRCKSQEDFLEMEAHLLVFGQLFHRSIYNGRTISLINLDRPIVVQGHDIYLIELPAPKANKSYPNGFEHAEFVVPSDLAVWSSKYPLDWDTRHINKAINPDIRLTFHDICVKFHPYSLAHVVKNLES